MIDGVMTAEEELVMQQSFKATMLRAAAIIDGITHENVREAQLILYAAGVPLSKLAKVDRALVASCYLRACAEGMAENASRRIGILREAMGK